MIFKGKSKERGRSRWLFDACGGCKFSLVKEDGDWIQGTERIRVFPCAHMTNDSARMSSEMGFHISQERSVCFKRYHRIELVINSLPTPPKNHSCQHIKPTP